MTIFFRVLFNIMFLLLILLAVLYFWSKYHKEISKFLSLLFDEIKKSISDVKATFSRRKNENEFNAYKDQEDRSAVSINQYKTEIANLNKQINKLKSKNRFLNEEVNSLEKIVLELRNEIRVLKSSKNINKRSSPNKKESKSHFQSNNRYTPKKRIQKEPLLKNNNSENILYADSIFENSFHSVTLNPDENTVFILNKGENGRATFDVYPKAHKRVLINHTFLDGCDKQVLNNSTKVTTNSLGEATLQADGKWEVTKKLNVTVS